MKTYKKISKDYIPFTGFYNVFFNDEIIGLLNIKENLKLSIEEQYINYTCVDTGNNIRESKLVAINVNAKIQLILNENNLDKFTNCFSEETYKLNINLNVLGTNKKGKLSILDENNKGYIFNNAIIKNSIALDINIEGLKLINLDFNFVPELIENEYILGEETGIYYFELSSLENLEEYGETGFDNGIFKE